MKFLLVTAAFGTGHRLVAEALAEAAVVQAHMAEVVDGLSICAPLISSVLTRGFSCLLNTAPSLYRMAYTHSEAPGRSERLKSGVMDALTQLMWPRLARLVERIRPDVILCTHPFMLGVLANFRRQGRIHIPVVGVLTDFAPHSFWIHAGVDAYCLATPSMIHSMIEQGASSRQLHDTGIPIRGMFTTPPDRRTASLYLGLDPDLPTVLLMGGGLGMGPMRRMVTETCRLSVPLQVLVVTGHNRRLYERLLPLASHSSRVLLRVYAYVPYVHCLMAASDVLVGKAGGVTASEALAMGLPMLFVHPIPGHEERNQAALVAAGAAHALQDPSAIAAALSRLLAHPEEAAVMRNAARRMGRPGAAHSVIRHMVRLAEHPRGFSTADTDKN